MTGAKIKSLRRKLQLTQEQLAHRLGVSFATVNRWEKGKSEPLAAHARLLRDLASCGPDKHDQEVPRRPVFGTLAGTVALPDDKYLLNEPAEVRRELYGEDYV